MYLLQQNTFEIQCSSQAFGIELQQQLSSLLEKNFYPQLEQLFIEYDAPGVHWVIDQLSVELPDISKKYWKEELIQKTLAQIEEYLTRNSPKTEFRIVELLGDTSYTIPSEKKATLVLFDFLRNGYFPLNTFSDKIDKLMELVLIDNDFVQELLTLFGSDLNILMRWIFAVPEEYKAKVLTFLPNSFNGFHFTKVILEEIALQKRKKNNAAEKLFPNGKSIQQWYELIQWTENLRHTVSFHKVFSFLNATMQNNWNISTAEILQFLELADNKSDLNDSEILFFKLWISYIKENVADESLKNHSEENIRMNKMLEEIQNNKRFSEDQIFYVNNAGLVILHPFLPTLFEQLELTENKEWVNKTALQKAVLLTHYLVFGDSEIYESQLILNKILCGLSIDEVINTQLILEENEKERCNSLLDAVLDYWKIMSNSSKGALQETFLKREGKLELQVNGFEMWMEEKGYDILLEQLPWGIGIIQTPWMDSYLTCNWNQ